MESDGSIRNGYAVKVLNMIPEPRVITVSIEGMPGAVMKIAGYDTTDGRSVDIPADPDKVTALRVFVTLPKDKLSEAAEGFKIVAEDRQGHESRAYSAKFNMPGAR